MAWPGHPLLRGFVRLIDRIDLAYAAADVIVCRAGANTVTEVSAVGLPAVFVPLPIGNGEQARNAHAVVQAGGGVLIDDDAFTSSWVDRALIPLITSADRLSAMSRAAAGIVRRDADEHLADLIAEAAESGPPRSSHGHSGGGG